MRKPYGKVSLSNLVALLVVAAAIYAVIVFAPPILDNLEVKETMSKAYNQAGRMSDDQIKAFIIQDLDRKGSRLEVDEATGLLTEVPGFGLTNDNVYVDRNTVTGQILIRVSYRREFFLKPTQSVTGLNFSPEKEGPIE